MATNPPPHVLHPILVHACPAHPGAHTHTTHLGRADLKLIALAPHGLDEDAQVQRAAPADDKGVGSLSRLHTHRQVALQLPAQEAKVGCVRDEDVMV